jgi:hypothetical protein
VVIKITKIILGLCVLHSNGIAHFDLKPGNILIEDNGNLKICFDLFIYLLLFVSWLWWVQILFKGNPNEDQIQFDWDIHVHGPWAYCWGGRVYLFVVIIIFFFFFFIFLERVWIRVWQMVIGDDPVRADGVHSPVRWEEWRSGGDEGAERGGKTPPF